MLISNIVYCLLFIILKKKIIEVEVVHVYREIRCEEIKFSRRIRIFEGQKVIV